VTGNALDDDVTDFMNAGADIVFSKPLRLESVDSVLSFVQSHGCQAKMGYRLAVNGNNVERIKYSKPRLLIGTEAVDIRKGASVTTTHSSAAKNAIEV